MFFMSDYSINFSYYGVSYSHGHYVVLFIAANLKKLTLTFPSHQHNSSTVPLNTPKLWSTPSPIHSCYPIPGLENFMSGEQVNMLFCYNVVLEDNITCKTIICQFDLCCTVTYLRHYTHISRLFTYSHKHNIKPTLPNISNKINNSRSHFPCSVL